MKGQITPYIANGIAAFLFSCTGPVAIVLWVATTGDLSDRHVASWLLAGFGIAGAYTLYFTLRYRQPIAFAWTIPGTVLLVSALDHLPISDVIGAYFVTAILIVLVGLSGWVERIMNAIPRSIVMAMVAGIFLDFGLKMIAAFSQAPPIAISMVVSFILFSIIPALARTIPPILAALIFGTITTFATDGFVASGALNSVVATPIFFTPTFSIQAILELVVPLAITVLVVQNGQGYAVLTNVGHKPPLNSMTVACGTGSILFAVIGAVTMCVTGPSNAILSSSGETKQQYIGGITYGVLAIAFGIFSGLTTWLAFQLPQPYIAVLGGLAVFKVLESAFVISFSDKHATGALVTFLVTVSNITLLNIGAPFWGLVFGIAITWLIHRFSSV